MITEHHPKHTESHRPDKPARCLRHDVWMAICDDCRTERAELVRAARERTGATR